MSTTKTDAAALATARSSMPLGLVIYGAGAGHTALHALRSGETARTIAASSSFARAISRTLDGVTYVAETLRTSLSLRVSGPVLDPIAVQARPAVAGGIEVAVNASRLGDGLTGLAWISSEPSSEFRQWPQAYALMSSLEFASTLDLIDWRSVEELPLAPGTIGLPAMASSSSYCCGGARGYGVATTLCKPQTQKAVARDHRLGAIRAHEDREIRIAVLSVTESSIISRAAPAPSRRSRGLTLRQLPALHRTQNRAMPCLWPGGPCNVSPECWRRRESRRNSANCKKPYTSSSLRITNSFWEKDFLGSLDNESWTFRLNGRAEATQFV